MRRRRFLGGIALFSALAGIGPAIASQRRFFRIGTGGITGTYYPIGGLISDIVSKPEGSRPCERGGHCGVPGLVALAQTSSGSVENIRSIVEGSLESGLAQSDIAYGAFAGSGVFAGEDPASRLRAIANLYAESMHLLVARDSGIEGVRDLKNKRISIDEVGSGTLVDSLLLLGAYGLTINDIDVVNVKPGPAISLMQNGELDGLFIIAGYPATAVAEMIDRFEARLIPLEGPELETLIQERPFFTPGSISASAYGLDDDVPTLNVGAQWFTDLDEDEELIYEICRALWSDQARAKLDAGHPKGKSIRIETALDGVAVPLHPGAARYYAERGLIEP